MGVTYNKINWDEETPITVANLDKIDTGIDEVVTQSNSNESRITTNESDISSNEDRITTNEGDINDLNSHNNDKHSNLFLPLDNLQTSISNKVTTSTSRAVNLSHEGYILGMFIKLETVSGSGSVDVNIYRRTNEIEEASIMTFNNLISGEGSNDTIALGSIFSPSLSFGFSTSVNGTKEYTIQYILKWIEGNFAQWI